MDLHFAIGDEKELGKGAGLYPRLVMTFKKPMETNWKPIGHSMHNTLAYCSLWSWREAERFYLLFRLPRIRVR